MAKHKSEYDKLLAALQDATNDMRDKAGERLNDSVDHIKGNLTDYTAKKPIKSLLIALTTGFAIGYFAHR